MICFLSVLVTVPAKMDVGLVFGQLITRHHSSVHHIITLATCQLLIRMDDE